MPYVSCQYAPPDPTGMSAETKQGENARVTCTDDNGVVWWLSEDSQVGDWLTFKSKGGTVEAYVAPIEGKPAPEKETPA